MTQYFGSVISNLFAIYKEINPATLTGAIDVIAVEQPNGTILCSPFHVRFGKMGVMRSKEKIVDIEVNGEPVDLHMKLGDSGEAYFVEDVAPGDEVPANLATSPISSSSAVEAVMSSGIKHLKVEAATAGRSVSDGDEFGRQKAAAISVSLFKNNANNIANASSSEPNLAEEKQSVLDSDGAQKPTFNLESTENTKEDRSSDNASCQANGGFHFNLELNKNSEPFCDSCDEVDKTLIEQQQPSRKKKMKHTKRKAFTPTEAIPMPERVCLVGNKSAPNFNRTLSCQEFSASHKANAAILHAGTVTSHLKSSGPPTPTNTPVVRSLSFREQKSFSQQQKQQQQHSSCNLHLISEHKETSSNRKQPLDEAIFAMDELSDTESTDERRAKLNRELAEDSFTYPSSSDAVFSHSPKSDSELENYKRQEKLAAEKQQEPLSQTEWKWGELPHTTTHLSGTTSGSEQEDDCVVDGWGITSMFPFIRKSRKGRGSSIEKSNAVPGGGIYLDELIKTSDQLDPKIAAIYFPKRTGTEKQRSISASEHLDSRNPLPCSTQNPSTSKDLQKVSSKPSVDAETTSATAIPPPLQHPEEAVEPVNITAQAPPEYQNGYPTPPLSPRMSDDLGYLSSKPSSFSDTEENQRKWEELRAKSEETTSDLALSLCGCSKEITKKEFEEKLVSFEQVVENPSILLNSDLVVRMRGRFFPWNIAVSILAGAQIFKRELPETVLSDLVLKQGWKFSQPTQLPPVAVTEAENLNSEKQQTAATTTAPSSSGYFSYFWRRAASVEPLAKDDDRKKPMRQPSLAQFSHSSSDLATTNNSVDVVSSVTETDSKPAQTAQFVTTTANAAGLSQQYNGSATTLSATPTNNVMRKPSLVQSTPDLTIDSDDESTAGQKPVCKKTLRLTSEQLQKLNLKKGTNEIRFSVTTKFQGTAWCSCHLYLWRHDDKIVISDIDGTITKSDVLGHILPLLGSQWAQAGVAKLFNRIADNGYRVLYLSARAIGQKDTTKSYLQWIRQDELCLPEGPLLLSPTSLMAALHREVIEKKPELFKISALKDIKMLFPKNPFFAGYGNKINDVFAYRAVGVPVSRIFIINPAGEVRYELVKGLQTTYSHLANEYVDYVFPPLVSSTNWCKNRDQSMLDSLLPLPLTPTTTTVLKGEQEQNPGENCDDLDTEDFSSFRFWIPEPEHLSEVDDIRFPAPIDPNKDKKLRKKLSTTSSSSGSPTASKGLKSASSISTAVV